jgi:hypothetical protein
MVSAGNYKHNRLVTIVGTLRRWSVSQRGRQVPVVFAYHAITESLS